MTMDTEMVVQANVPEGTEAKVEPVVPEITEAQKLETLIQQKVADAVEKATRAATESAKREIQSAKDRSRAEVESAVRRARLAEGTLGMTKAQIRQLDPDVAKEMELAEYRAKEANRAQLEQEEQARQAQGEFHQKFHDNLNQFITSLGVDPSDKRIDWASDAPNYLEAQRRVLDSVAIVQKEALQTAQAGLEKRLKDLEAKVRQPDVEANSVETTASPGVVAGSDAEFIKKFGAGDLPMTKVTMDRYAKIQKTY